MRGTRGRKRRPHKGPLPQRNSLECYRPRPAPVLGDRRHTYARNLGSIACQRLCIGCLGTVEVRVAFQGGQSLDATRHRSTAHSPFGAGGCRMKRPRNPRSRRTRAPHGRAASGARTRGATGEPSAGGGKQRGSTHRSAAGPPAPVLGDRRHTLRKKLRLYCMPKILHRMLGDRRSTRGL